MKLLHKLATIILPAICAASCQDADTTLGSSLVDDETQIIVDSAFTATAHAVTNPVVQSRTLTQLIGRLDAKQFGKISSDFVCQFLPTLNLDTLGVTEEAIDSVKLIMFMTPGDFTGDSLVPMGMQVYPLTKALPSPIYSDFDPTGYYDPTPIGEQVYTAHAMYSDSINSLSYRSITVTLPVSLGREIFRKFSQQPDIFASPEQFAQWFPGLYVTTSFGSGRIININETRINFYYRQHGTTSVSENVQKDTVYNRVKSYLAVTPEVVTNNDISLTMSTSLTERIAAGDPILVAPAGTEVQLTFPTARLIEAYRSGAGQLSVLNDLTFTIPAEEIANDYNIAPPEQILLILSNLKDKFFADNKITDSKTSFVATYNAATKSYTFSSMRQYLLQMLEKTSITDDDCTFTITPVNVQNETTSSSYYSSGTTYVTTIGPYVTKPAMVNLDIKNAKIKLTFTRQSAK